MVFCGSCMVFYGFVGFLGPLSPLVYNGFTDLLLDPQQTRVIL